MAHDRARFANPLRRQHAQFMHDKQAPHLTKYQRKHLRLTIETYLKEAHTYEQQQRAASGIFAQQMKLIVESKLQATNPEKREFINLTNAYYKWVLIANHCLSLRGGQKGDGNKPRVSPPRRSEATSHAGQSEAA